VALIATPQAHAQCSKANCKITLQTGAGSPFLKGCGEGADIGRIEYFVSSPNGQATRNDFQGTYLMQTQSAHPDHKRIVTGKLEYRTPGVVDNWADVFENGVNLFLHNTGLDVPRVWEFRAKAGQVIGNSKGTGRKRTTMEILKVGGEPTNVTVESRHQPLFFLGGEGCGQWGFGHGHVYDPDTGERVR